MDQIPLCPLGTIFPCWKSSPEASFGFCRSLVFDTALVDEVVACGAAACDQGSPCLVRAVCIRETRDEHYGRCDEEYFLVRRGLRCQCGIHIKMGREMNAITMRESCRLLRCRCCNGSGSELS